MSTIEFDLNIPHDSTKSGKQTDLFIKVESNKFFSRPIITITDLNEYTINRIDWNKAIPLAFQRAKEKWNEQENAIGDMTVSKDGTITHYSNKEV